MTEQNQIKALAEIGAVNPKLCLISYDAIIPLIQKQLNKNIILRDRFYLQWPDGRYLFNATPAQLSEALLRATGKWEDGE